MMTILLLLVQLTVLLGIALLASSSIRANAPRSHRIILSGLVCIFALPFFAQVANELGWGFLPPTVATNDFENDSQNSFGPTHATILGTVPHDSEGVALDRSTDGQFDALVDSDLELLNPKSGALPPTENKTSKTNQSNVISNLDHNLADLPTETSVQRRRSLLAIIPFKAVLLSLWALASALMTSRLILGVVKARRIVRTSQSITDTVLESALSSAMADLKISNHIRLRSSSELSCPVIWSWGLPTIILPNDSIKDKDLDWRGIFTHELAHLKRKDHWSTFIAEASRCVLPWHPLVIYSGKRLYQLSELACDAWAIKFSKTPENYAESLLAFTPVFGNPTKHRFEHFGFSAMATRGSNIEQRVTSVLANRSQNPNSGFVFNVVICVLAVVLASTIALIRTYRPVEPAAAIVETSESSEGTSLPHTPSADNLDDEASTTEETAAKTETVDELTNEQWVKDLTGHPESSNWFVGKSLGTALSKLPGDRGYRILKSCWKDIAVSVRQQILKGFSFESTPNTEFFKVMDLGMTSDKPKIRQFATGYLKTATMKDFAGEPESYKTWYATTAGMTAEQIISREVKNLVSRARDPKTRNVRGLLTKLRDPDFARESTRSPIYRKAVLESGLEELLNEWADADFIEKDDLVFKTLKDIRDAGKYLKPLSPVTLESTDEQWLAHLRAVPKTARWNIGANLGATMTHMPPDRVRKILNQCWSEIDAGVRTQILKGFNPGFGVANDAFLDVMNLGFDSQDKRVQDFAKTYLSEMALREFENKPEYETWYEANKGKSPEKVFEEALTQRVNDLDPNDKLEFNLKMQELSDYRISNQPFPDAISNSGLNAKLEELLVQGKLRLANLQTITLLKRMKLPAGAMQAGLDRELNSMIENWEKFIASGEKDKQALREMHGIASSLGQINAPYILPTMIGLIQADNSLDTVYYVGYFGFRSTLPNVNFNRTHDGAWWGRWWDKNKSNYPEEIQKLEIPVLAKSKHGASYSPYPEEMNTTAGALAWVVEQLKSEKAIGPGVELIAEELKDPTAIPVLIAVLEADNSPDNQQTINRALEALTGMQYHPIYSDGSWWLRWWDKNKTNFSKEVQQVSIPTLPKTKFGKTYSSISHLLEKTDGRIQLILDNPDDETILETIRDCAMFDSMVTPGNSQDIPKLIGILDCDNSARSISRLGRQLETLTAVPKSAFHDGNWWRVWWEKNKETFPESVRTIAIPDLPKTKYGKTHKPYPLSLETLDERIAFANTLASTDTKTYELILNSVHPREYPPPSDVIIPKLIGLFDADNSERAHSSFCAHTLYELSGVERQVFHDGPWWRRWWGKNRIDFSKEAQATAIPEIKKTAYGKNYRPFPADFESTDNLITWAKQGCPSDRFIYEFLIGKALASTNDPKSIPVIIGWAIAADSSEIIRDAGESFQSLTGVKHSRSQTPEWWKQWWNKNKDRFELSKTDAEIPDMKSAVEKHRANANSKQR